MCYVAQADVKTFITFTFLYLYGYITVMYYMCKL